MDVVSESGVITGREEALDEEEVWCWREGVRWAGQRMFIRLSAGGVCAGAAGRDRRDDGEPR